VYKTAKSRGTKVELISSSEISTGFAEARQARKAMQADDGEEASPPNSPTAVLGSQSCAACVGLIPRDWPRRFEHCRWGLACHGRSSKHVGENEMSLLTGGILFVGMISKSLGGGENPRNKILNICTER